MDHCIADGCDRPAEKDRKYCHGHRKREKKHTPVDTPLRQWGATPDKYLEAKALELADAKDGDERAYALARKRLKYAATEYAKKSARQKVPNTTKTPSRG